MNRFYTLLFLSTLVLGPFAVPAQSPARFMPTTPAINVTYKINLLKEVARGQVEYNVNPTHMTATSPEAIFALRRGVLTISGQGMGYMSTMKSFKNYRLIIEYRWVGNGIAPRADNARDNGILIHARGRHGALDGTWPASIESNIIEGGMGDFIVLSDPQAQDPKALSSVTASIQLDRDGETVWSPDGEHRTLKGGRVNWQFRDPDWKDVRGYRGADDPDRPAGEWNRMEIVADGAAIRVYVNGRQVNEAFEVHPSEGHICIQTEFAGMQVRRWTLYPLRK